MGKEIEYTEILKILNAADSGLKLDEINHRMQMPMAVRTLARRLQEMLKAGSIKAEGNARARLYRAAPPPMRKQKRETLAEPGFNSGIPLSREGQEILSYVSQPLSLRRPLSYDRDFLNQYIPNETWYLNETLRKQLLQISSTGRTARPAGTYGRAILDRLLIDLSWASSHLEGNTYSRLDTKSLIEFGHSAAGKGATETQMILNHKAAIEFLLDEIDSVDFDRRTILNLHGLLSDNLMPDRTSSGRLRQRPVDIAGTIFRPLALPQVIDEMFEKLLLSARQIQNPFEQAFFLMVHIPYLQPFEDVNKRVSRLAANIPLLKNNLCPLTFLGVSEEAYVQATLGVYEMTRVELLRDLFIWGCERSAQEYLAIQKSMAEPDPIRLRYRVEIQNFVRTVVVELHLDPRAQAEAFARKEITADDRSAFIAEVLGDIENLHEGILARYRIRPSEFTAWQKKMRIKN